MFYQKQVKKLLISSFGIVALITGFVAYAAQTPDAFVIDIQPSSFDVNTPVDVTVKAVNAKGEAMKEYEGDVFVDIQGTIDTSEYTVPSDGLYTFLPQDQGVKLFSKGLTIEKAGTFTVRVSDITNDQIKGEKTVIVGGGASTEVKPVEIISPAKGGIEKSSIVNIMGMAAGLGNTPLEVYANDVLVGEDETSSNGDFSVYVSGFNQGTNTFQVKLLDSTHTVIGQSEIISFSYDPLNDANFKEITLSTPNKVVQGTKVMVTIKTSDAVTSSVLKLSNGRDFPMDMESAGIFTKEVNMDTEGKIVLGLELLAGGQKKAYSGVTSLTVIKGANISKVRVFADAGDKTKLHLTWDIGGDVKKFNIMYGDKENALDQSQIVDAKEANLSNLNPGTTYFFKVVPLDENNQEIGPASAIMHAVAGEEGETSCIVQGIQVRDEKIGNKYYLTRSGVINVEKYQVFRSDFETNDITKMTKVGETTETRFEYPFNRKSKEEKFAFYAVQAICKDGKELMMDNIKKVRTGPGEVLMLVVFLGVLGFSFYRLHAYVEQK